MDWNEYKALCDQPSTFSRWMLEQTLELAQDKPALADVLRTILRGKILDKPADHSGDHGTDMFEVRLDVDRARAIQQLILEAVLSGRRTVATQQRGLGGFVETWRDYVKFLEAERTTTIRKT